MASERILVVDDNPTNLKLLSFLLESQGYEVRVAETAAQALAVLECFAARLILMDIQLPDIDGLTLTRRLRASGLAAGVAIVAVTAYAMKGDEQRAIAAGCNGYISKPIDTRTLPARVAAFLAAGSTTGETP